MIDPKGLQLALGGGRRLFVFLHDNPDPDAIAAGWLLAQVGSSLGLEETRLVHGGSLGRAENAAMVRLLDIPLSAYEPQQERHRSTDRYALVDTQPLAENNSFPETLRAHAVIDHHPRRGDLEADFVDVRQEDGCTSTLLLRYHQAFGLDLTPALATAAFYAIISETQDLEREASKADLDACQRLFSQVQLTTLGKIRHPPRERDYFRTIARAMNQVLVGKNTCTCHIGPVQSPEMVAEVADLLVRMKQVTWCLVSGHFQQLMHVSIRTTHPQARAEQVMRQVLKGAGSGGGHAMMAGGAAPCPDAEQYDRLAERFSQRFLEALPRRVPETLNPLLGPD